MHEFLLFGQVTSSEQRTLLQQLAGVTRMQPQHVIERHVLFRPKLPAGLNNMPSGGGSQGVLPPEVQKTRNMLNATLFHLQLVCEVGKNTFGAHTQPSVTSGTIHRDGANSTSEGASSSHLQKPKWVIEFKDIPEAGKQPFTSRLTSKTPVETGEANAFLNSFGYEYVSQYVVEGDRFYDQDITLFLHRIMLLPQGFAREPNTAADSLPAIEELQPLDSSGGYIISASIETVDGNSPELKEKVLQQLTAMKETLKQAVILTPGDRLALDTRASLRIRRP